MSSRVVLCTLLLAILGAASASRDLHQEDGGSLVSTNPASIEDDAVVETVFGRALTQYSPPPPPATALPAWFFDVFIYDAQTKTLAIKAETLAIIADVNVANTLQVGTDATIRGGLNLQKNITYITAPIAPTAPSAPIQTYISTSIWGARWTDGSAGVPAETYKIRCVQLGGACQSSVVAESLTVKRGVQEATVSGLTAGAQLTCFVVASNSVGDVCSPSIAVSIPTTTVFGTQVWTTRTPAKNYNWNSVIWSGRLQIFLAVSDSGYPNQVMTSPDGVTWTSRSNSVNGNSWLSVTWGGPSGSEKFVTVSENGSGNRVMTSPDGVTWTSRTSAADNRWNSVTWGGPSGSQIFVAVAGSGTGNRVMTSPDGVTWTSRISAADNEWRSVTWGGPSGNQKFVAVASTGSGNRVMTSPDGMKWTSRLSASNNQWYSVTWGGPSGSQRFVAVSSDGTGNRVMTSPDGVTWTSRFSAADNRWTFVTWGGPSGSEKFVAVSSDGGGNRVMTSPDGVTWTSQTSAVNNDWRSVTWGGPSGSEKFVAVARGYTFTGNLVMTCPT